MLGLGPIGTLKGRSGPAPTEKPAAKKVRLQLQHLASTRRRNCRASDSSALRVLAGGAGQEAWDVVHHGL